ncbi:MAG: hypothetical protein K2H32_01695 [Muribaculaceae bacterium]|nr:hypothetical protein [Muribaculaceae bacterium]MDE5844966.1 hypothetical protein [Muribaculaceae bacterium]MDE5857063.1 hypothetical protein [Muribaculaceae bacterium]
MIENKKKKYTGARVMTPAEMNRLHFDSEHTRLNTVDRRDMKKKQNG